MSEELKRQSAEKQAAYRAKREKWRKEVIEENEMRRRERVAKAEERVEDEEKDKNQ